MKFIPTIKLNNYAFKLLLFQSFLLNYKDLRILGKIMILNFVILKLIL